MNFQEAAEITQSPVWEAYAKELDMRITNCISKLRTCNPTELRELQIRISIYEEMKRLPKDVKDREMQ